MIKAEGKSDFLLEGQKLEAETDHADLWFISDDRILMPGQGSTHAPKLHTNGKPTDMEILYHTIFPFYISLIKNKKNKKRNKLFTYHNRYSSIINALVQKIRVLDIFGFFFLNLRK